MDTKWVLCPHKDYIRLKINVIGGIQAMVLSQLQEPQICHVWIFDLQLSKLPTEGQPAGKFYVSPSQSLPKKCFQLPVFTAVPVELNTLTSILEGYVQRLGGVHGYKPTTVWEKQEQWTLYCWSWHRLLMTLFTCEHTSAKHHQAMYVQEAEFYSSMGKQYTTVWPCLPTPNASNTISITPVAPPR